MQKKTKIIGGAALAAVLVLGGTGIAYAATDGFEGSDALTGGDLDRAATVASEEIGGGSVTSAERDDDGYELELKGDDGRYYEVELDGAFGVVSSSADDRVGDTGSSSSGSGSGESGESGTGGTGGPADGGDDEGAGAGAGSASVDPDDLQGEELEKASAAAIAEAGGGTVTDAETSDDADHAYDVEVRLDDGTEVDIDLDASFGVVRTEK
ncbi:PepSY domain-containing protein [Herbiconiux sp. VKM Ac-2851]|uniref:PepSY domain-containing protein n=1 Tax=Herbiconiux sp. VKM Ac-2851 TaxID=2739025 RepID=UPI0015643668|nr:PepSY domain-containing protein [Herbiconiux sp. VKM Ac-2851]NQX35054.1 PepSY domain-containing protein [Herbiconiux sp. VKM Ac-2851]